MKMHYIIHIRLCSFFYIGVYLLLLKYLHSNFPPSFDNRYPSCAPPVVKEQKSIKGVLTVCLPSGGGGRVARGGMRGSHL